MRLYTCMRIRKALNFWKLYFFQKLIYSTAPVRLGFGAICIEQQRLMDDALSLWELVCWRIYWFDLQQMRKMKFQAQQICKCCLIGDIWWWRDSIFNSLLVSKSEIEDLYNIQMQFKCRYLSEMLDINRYYFERDLRETYQIIYCALMHFQQFKWKVSHIQMNIYW